MVKNQELALQIVEIIGTLMEASEELTKYLQGQDIRTCEIITDDMRSILETIYPIAVNLKEEQESIKLPDAIKTVNASLNRIKAYIMQDVKRAIHKVEFELKPFINETRTNFCFFACAYPNKQKMLSFYENERKEWKKNKYIEISEKTGNYKYDLSIMVVAYNKLEYTKMCIECIKKYAPINLKYELILFNNGSTDETKDYFETIKLDKQLDIEVNYSVPYAFYDIVEGKYLLAVSNDVLVTENAIENMFIAMESDEKVGWLVPTTPNVSNLQTIPAEYQNLEEMFEFARENNISDRSRWEQRVRLCNPIDMRRSKLIFELGIPGFYMTDSPISFPDDKDALLYRRAGYKLVLAKDAYCYHFGSMTISEELSNNQIQEKFYTQGRNEFMSLFGIDPWGTGMCYSLELIEALKFVNSDKKVNIMGINCGLGGNPLKIKECLKEKYKNEDLINIENYIYGNSAHLNDVTKVSDKAESFSRWEKFEDKSNSEDYDYIIVEEGLEQYTDYKKVVKGLWHAIKSEGILAVKVYNEKTINWIQGQFSDKANINMAEYMASIQNGRWVIINKK